MSENKIKIPSPYFRFLHDKMHAIKIENADLSAGEQTKLILKIWLNLPKNEKQVYIDSYNNDVKKLYIF